MQARTRAAGGLRADFAEGDLSLIFEQLASIAIGTPERAAELRQRYLALLLEAMRNPSGDTLPGPPPSWEEIRARYGDARNSRDGRS